MGKFFVFYLIYRLTGNPILAILLIVLVYYFIDRRYIGLLPSLLKPFRRQMRMSNLERQLHLNPHDQSARHDLAQLQMQRRRYQSALTLLAALPASMQESADVLYDTGACQLALGQTARGEELVLRALAKEPRLRYGEPYLKLATALAATQPEKALQYVTESQKLNISSCESYYRMAQLYKRFGDSHAAEEARKQCLDTYRTLPRFRKRTERRWALFASWRLF